MRVDELFNGHDQVQEIAVGPEFERKYSLEDVCAAYLLPIKGDEYIFFFEGGKDGLYSFGYGKVVLESWRLNFDLTHKNIPFQIVPAAIEVLRQFINKYHPRSVGISGFVNRQDVFYERLAQKMKTRTPPGYFLAKKAGKIYLTNNPWFRTNPNYEILESAEQDFNANQRAATIVHTFQSWLAEKNESVPLEDILHHHFVRGSSAAGDVILYATGKEIGLTGCDDLFLGFAFNPVKVAHGERYGPTHGYHSVAKNSATGEKIHFVALTCDHNPSKDTDVAFGLNTEFLVHEVTHYLDRKRQSPTAGYNGKSSHDPAAYFNSPFEFNAFFQQGVHNILKNLNRRGAKEELETFESFTKNNLFNFDYDFRQYLTPEYKRKLTRRLYKLWVLLKANYPDLHLIGQKAEQIKD